MKGKRVLVILFVSFFFAACCAGRTQPNNQKVNILFILADDLGWADLGYTGSKFHETPNIDQLATEGMVFTNAYAASPVCSPSRAAIMSGNSPARLNLTDYIPGNQFYGPHKDQKLASHPFKLQLDLEEFTLAEALQGNGYKTFFAGKWHLGEEEKYYPDKQGFQTNRGGNNTGHPAGGYFSPYKNPQLKDGPVGEYLTDRLTNEVIGFMEKNTNTPFFAYLSFYTVHLPLQPKPEKEKKYKEKLAGMKFEGETFTREGKTWFRQHQNLPEYAAMVESLDENVGRLLDAIDRLKLKENTIIVFTSDNGGMSSSNQTGNIPTTNAPLRAGKGYLYEGGIREPLIISWPSKVKAGSRCEEPVAATDFYPTLLDLAGLDLLPNQHQDGVSIKPLLVNKTMKERPIFWHYPHYSGGLGGKPSGAVRLGDFKLIEFFEDMHVELYNLKKDIGETNDLSGKYPLKTKELKAMLHQWRKVVAAQMPYENPYYQKPIKK